MMPRRCRAWQAWRQWPRKWMAAAQVVFQGINANTSLMGTTPDYADCPQRRD